MDYGGQCDTGMTRRLVCLTFLVLLMATRTRSQGGRPTHVRIRPPPMVADYVSPQCWNFTVGNWRLQEFYSPNWPNYYTNSTDCVQYLEAPPGFTIQLDFRDKFDIEKSEDCQFDFLEVRDGPFAYSPLVGRFCGQSYPPLIESTSGFLWLRFKTDDLLLYGGFRAIYSYLKKDTQNDGTPYNKGTAPVCRVLLEVGPERPDGVISSSQVPFGDTSDPSYPRDLPVDCSFEIHAPQGFGIHLKTMDMSMLNPGRCESNFVSLFKRTTLDTDRYRRHCSPAKVSMKSVFNRVFVRLYGGSLAQKPNVTMAYTVFRLRESGLYDLRELEDAIGDALGPDGVQVDGEAGEGTGGDLPRCEKDQFQCGGMCLAPTLVCNAIPNCPQGEDEKDCETTEEATPTAGATIPLHAIILGAVGGVLLTCVTVVLCVTCSHRRRHNKRRKEALRQQALQQKNALDLAVSSSSNTSYSLSRQHGGHSPGSAHPGLVMQRPGPGGVVSRDPAHRLSLASSAQQSSEGEPLEHTTLPDSGQYKRFLTLEMTPDVMEETHLPSLYTQTGLVPIERHPPPDVMMRAGGGMGGWRGWGRRPSCTTPTPPA